MIEYQELIHTILNDGHDRKDRTGVGTRSIFGYQMRFDLSDDKLPLVTTKRVPFKHVMVELLWMLSGSTNVADLWKHGVKIWDEWADEHGDLGPIYGKQWRNFRGVDQIYQVVKSLRQDRYSRRHIVTAWNPEDLPHMALAPCHCLFQFYVEDDRLSCQLYQRSADVFLGVPFNIASYSALTMMMAQVCGLKPGEFVHTFGDVHLYHNHFEQADTLLKRDPRPSPTLLIDPTVREIYDFTVNDFALVGYDPHPKIEAPIAV